MKNFNIEYENFCEQTIACAIAKTNGGLLLPNPPGKDSEKDFIIYEPVAYELKCDRESDKYGNAFLETWNCRQNKPSGLSITKAFWWIVYTPSEALLYRFHPWEMLDFCKRQKVTFKEGAGDGNSNGYVLALARMRAMNWITHFKFPPL